ncbi:MAG: BON domain-containing protein [Polyangiaceae bacterium]
MRHQYSLVLGATASLAVFSACKAERGAGQAATTSAIASATPATAHGNNEAQDAAAPIVDTKLVEALEVAIGRDPALRAHALQVSVVNGGVTLRGTVPALALKRRAAQLVSSFKGASSITNAIVVGGPALSDAEIAKGVNDAVKRDPATRRANVQATASGGTVTLRGGADSLTQRELLVENASRVRGVKEVKLEVVSTAAPRGSAEIVADVTDRFGDDARLDGARLSVAVHGRTAAVSGLVGSLAQRDAATEDAFVSGVDEVDTAGLRVDWRENERARAATQGPLPSDAHIPDVVRRDLAGDVRVGLPLPTVRVDQGVVTLSGNVMDFRAARAAARDANDVRGVWWVVDQMTVAPAVGESDATIEAQAQETVYNDPSAPDAHDVQVATASARVTLHGAVASPEEKMTIASDVEEVPGVVAVENDLQVKGYDSATHVLPPASLRERVIESIFWDPRVGGGEVTPDVAPNGDVTLTGLVYSWGEARSAGEDALRAGAARLTNRIHLAGSPAFSPPPSSSR